MAGNPHAKDRMVTGDQEADESGFQIEGQMGTENQRVQERGDQTMTEDWWKGGSEMMADS